jgi:riboflavin kinase/FMN adenylyltransferase
MKRQLLRQAGVTHLLELEPTPEVLNVTAEQFWARLRDEARPAHLVEGPDFNFGKGARGNVSLLREWTRSSGVNFTVLEPFDVTLPGMHIVPVSSSLIRWLIASGRVRDAAACLGRPYMLRGRVVEGYRRGAQLGFPTANLDVGEQLIPADGIYAGRAQVDGRSYRAAVSIGSAPTFEGARRQVEAYLLDFRGDLYGRTLDLELTGWVRDQMRFPSIERLAERIKMDVEMVSSRL